MPPKLRDNLTLARALAPEDIRPGIHVAVLEEIGQYVPFACVEPHVLRELPYRLAWLPCSPGRPLLVIDACLPFVLVEGLDGKATTLDVRQCRLGQLDERYARTARKRLAPARKRRKRSKDRGKGKKA